MTDENHETLARSLFTPEGKKSPPRRRPAKAETDSDPQETAHEEEIAKLQALVQAWESKYQQAQGELETLRPQLASLQAQVEQQAKLIQEQQAAISFWQQKAQSPAPPTLPTRPHHAVKPLPVPPKPSQPHPPDPLPDFMLD